MKTSPRGLRRLLVTAALPAALVLAGAARAADGWVNLFNGKNLDGWEQHSGTAKYRVEIGRAHV